MTTVPEQLRLLADFVEKYPELAATYSPQSHIFLDTKADALKAARIPQARKYYDDATFRIDIPLADDFSVRFFTYRRVVCTAKRIEKVIEPAKPEREVEKVVEWECHPLLEEDGRPSQTDKSVSDIPY